MEQVIANAAPVVVEAAAATVDTAAKTGVLAKAGEFVSKNAQVVTSHVAANPVAYAAAAGVAGGVAVGYGIGWWQKRGLKKRVESLEADLRKANAAAAQTQAPAPEAE